MKAATAKMHTGRRAAKIARRSRTVATMDLPDYPAVSTKVIGGKEMVVMPVATYDTLIGNLMDKVAAAQTKDQAALVRKLGRLARGVSENAGTLRIIARSNAALAAGLDIELPAVVAEAIMGGESPLRAVRKWRGKTQIELSEASGIDQGTISEMERVGGGPVANWRKAARTLKVPLDLIAPED